MNTTVTVGISAEEVTNRECAKILLHISEQNDAVELDLDVTALLATTRVAPVFGQDFLLIAAVVYAVDKAVSRKLAEDQWTRTLTLTIPVHRAAEWSSVAVELGACIGFLTGDDWTLIFVTNETGYVRKRKRQRRLPVTPPDVAAVCLLSGGLDSYIGALNWLVSHPDSRLLCVGHYDADVAGPGKDQRELVSVLQAEFPGKMDFAQARVGMLGQAADINFRSRSLLFLALGIYFADTIAAPVPLLIPENGPIALNFPLTPSRRGSCSTRTVHPDFIRRLNKILKKAGARHAIGNPYELRTKGEMVSECLSPEVLSETQMMTRSCAKANRRMHWHNRKARGCGVCIPCLFRRAALYVAAQDTEAYGIQVENITTLKAASADVLALCAFVRRDLDATELARGLLANGSLPLDKMTEYVSVVQRMREEVKIWLGAKGSSFVRNLAGL